MIEQIPDTNHSDILESMNQAFDNGSFYGLEYVLDEWAVNTLASTTNQSTVDWYGFLDFLA